MECKFKSVWWTSRTEHELIDTLWNVNEFDVTLKIFPSFELIDTLWNVNASWEELIKCLKKELIDTLWNVNRKKSWKLKMQANGINRYIMECK